MTAVTGRFGQVRDLLLEYGLEDVTAVPEAAQSPEIQAAAGGLDPVPLLSQVLSDLVKSRQVLMFRGPWKHNDPEPVSAETALELLRDTRWFQYDLDNPDEERLYFVNADNLKA